MKIVQLLSGIDLGLTNEEYNFSQRCDRVSVDSLQERDRWLAQNLVRKGLYTISKDNTLVKATNERKI